MSPTEENTMLLAVQNLNALSMLDSTISLLTAFILGGLVGFERQYRQRTAGLRTNVLVAVGAAIFVDMANRVGGSAGAVHVVAYVVSGIGFLGAGVIMREEGNVRGINTAATLWGSAAIGACAGADLIAEAVLATVFVLSANTLLRPVVDAVNRKPIDTAQVEVTTSIHLITVKAWRNEALQNLEEILEQHELAVHDMEIRPFGEGEIEIEATLATTSVDGELLDHLIEHLQESTQLTQAFWTSSTTD
ncbi:MAG: MgtC/SapB family protein [Halothiobacillus sp.]